jgi:hypothetical protein
MSIEVPSKFWDQIVSSIQRTASIIWNGLRDYAWFSKKKLQSIKRTHLSHILATILLILVFVREWPELSNMLWGFSWPTLFGYLILLVVFLTFVAARWELYGDKLTTSPQELRFHWGAKRSLKKLEELRSNLWSTSDPQRAFDSFVNELVEIAAGNFSIKYWVDAGVMIKDPDQDSLVLEYWSSLAEYPEGLRIPLPVAGDYSKTGPAGVAFADQVLVYVPSKKAKRAWPFVSLDDPEITGLPEPRYQPDYPVVCWIDAPPRFEDFRSVICVPIVTLTGVSPTIKFGVLNFSTKARDPFVDRDFFMAEFYAAILTQAFIALTDRLST